MPGLVLGCPLLTLFVESGGGCSEMHFATKPEISASAKVWMVLVQWFSVCLTPSLDNVDGDSPSGSAAGVSGVSPPKLLENIVFCFGVTFYLSLGRW